MEPGTSWPCKHVCRASIDTSMKYCMTRPGPKGLLVGADKPAQTDGGFAGIPWTALLHIPRNCSSANWHCWCLTRVGEEGVVRITHFSRLGRGWSVPVRQTSLRILKQWRRGIQFWCQCAVSSCVGVCLCRFITTFILRSVARWTTEAGHSTCR